MIVPLTLLICLTTTLRGIRAEDNADSATEELGKGINLRKTNLLKISNKERQACSSLCRHPVLSRKSYITQAVTLTTTQVPKPFTQNWPSAQVWKPHWSLRSLWALNSQQCCTKTDSKESKVSGTYLNVNALSEKILVKKDCLDDDEISTLTKKLVKDLEGLPLTIDKPWLANSRKAYNVFLETYGSHVATSVKRGSSIKQTTFAESSSSYSQRDFQVKSCLELAGPTNVGKVGVKACANVSKSEISKATKMNTEDKLIIRGGTKETRNSLYKQRTEDLIEKLLNEAGESDASVKHTFRSVWDILQSRFETGSDNYIRAVNLQYYYLGYLNYGCRFKESGGVQIQKFDYTRGSAEKSPEFECSLAAEGNDNDDDCHYKVGIWCSCRGKTCVHYKSVEQDAGIPKLTAYANTDEDWGWHGCDWKVAGFYCNCYNDNIGLRREVWRMPRRDASRKGYSHGAHHKSENPNQDQDPEQVQDLDPDQDQGREAKEGSNDLI